MNRKRVYLIIYAAAMITILVLFVAIDLSDAMQMILGAIAIILTSTFTYSNRRGISRTERKDPDSE